MSTSQQLQEWLHTGATVGEIVTGIATALTLVSIIILRKQLKADHERSRRERAIELMKFWCEQTSEQSVSDVCARRLIQELSREQCESIYAGESFRVDPKWSVLLKLFRVEYGGVSQRERNNKENVADELSVTKEESVVLRKLAAAYLNDLEAVATAWRHNVADRLIIEEEFAKLVSPRTNVFIHETYRAVTGSYPSIEELTAHIGAKKNERTSKQPTA